ncbi:MAG TPA: hypothetical protein VMR41_04160 [Patescibacteria group bacterium]|jgi:hypothetical protein|nr:hypothetical protein [Patescibacteria group bacterium]
MKHEFLTYRRGVKISGIKGIGNKNPEKRGIIRGISKSALKRLDWVYMQGDWKSMLLLTYHQVFPRDYKDQKRQLTTWLEHLRYKDIKYLWVVEWQKREFPHIHVWMNKRFDDCPSWEDKGTNSWRKLMKAWLKISEQLNDKKAVDFSMHQRNYTDWVVNSKVNYVRKYASKKEQKCLPDSIKNYGRWYGSSRDLVLEIDVTEFYEKEKIKEWNQFRRQSKRLIEKTTKVKFLKDKVGSQLPLKMIMNEDKVENVSRLSDYYLYYGNVDKGHEKIPF